MAQREWVEKDFYKELGVSPDAGQDEIKRVARKLLAENHPDRNPGNKAAEDRYKAVSEAKEVLTVNRAFKGVYLDRPGDYHLEFTYRPGHWQLACTLFWISAASACLLYTSPSPRD